MVQYESVLFKHLSGFWTCSRAPRRKEVYIKVVEMMIVKSSATLLSTTVKIVVKASIATRFSTSTVADDSTSIITGYSTWTMTDNSISIATRFSTSTITDDPIPNVTGFSKSTIIAYSTSICFTHSPRVFGWFLLDRNINAVIRIAIYKAATRYLHIIQDSLTSPLHQFQAPFRK
jgi:hypothetical protein